MPPHNMFNIVQAAVVMGVCVAVRAVGMFVPFVRVDVFMADRKSVV